MTRPSAPERPASAPRAEVTGNVVGEGSAADALANLSERARLERARSLYASGRAEEATSAAAALKDAADPAVRRSALALRAVLAAERGDLESARQLLTAALDGTDSWPGRARARADLATVLRALGHEAEATAEIRSARDDAEREGDWPAAVRSMQSEARWARLAGHEAEASELDARASATARERGVSLESR
ncbi:MAG TPA: hypothetical protein VKE69_15180 [Planctomycetota bacterium]|nr:hypothetical protein [Planctomycetota bacterium]